MGTIQNPISFLELARQVLAKEQKPLTIDEIWDVAEQTGFIAQLETVGKTPKATLGARLYTEAKTPKSVFVKLGARPARFTLRALIADLPQEALENQFPETTAIVPKSFTYPERDLHPLMVWFASTYFGAYCKTIYHEKGLKRGPKHNQWLYPDIAGFALNSKDWNHEVVNLAQQSGCRSARLFSFELKIALSDFSTLREYFFQAVSNSSWANQGYLAAANIDEDPEFREELKRLSQSFGIGVIHLDTSEPLDSEVILPARDKSEVDWETISRVAEDNVDFEDFVSSVANSLKVNQVVAKGFDVVLSDTELFEYAKKKLSPEAVKAG